MSRRKGDVDKVDGRDVGGWLWLDGGHGARRVREAGGTGESFAKILGVVGAAGGGGLAFGEVLPLGIRISTPEAGAVTGHTDGDSLIWGNRAIFDSGGLGDEEISGAIGGGSVDFHEGIREFGVGLAIPIFVTAGVNGFDIDITDNAGGLVEEDGARDTSASCSVILAGISKASVNKGVLDELEEDAVVDEIGVDGVRSRGI